MQRDRGRGRDLANIRPIIRAVDHGLWTPQWSLNKFWEHRDRVYKAAHVEGLPIKYLVDNFELMESPLRFPDNCLLNEGINTLWTLVAGTGATKWDNGDAYMGVGDSNTAENASQTGLQASTNKLYKAMDASYPTYGSSQLATWRSTFGTGDAIFHWQEITVSNSNSDAGMNLNRKAQDMGTKPGAPGATWVASLQITLT